MKKLILFLTLGSFLLFSCADKTNTTTGRDRTNIEKRSDSSKSVETPKEKSEPIKETPPVSSDDAKIPVKTFTVTLDGNESFWWVLVEFDEMKGNTLVMQDHPYLDLDELKKQLKVDFKRPNDNPFLLNFIQVSREMYLANSTSK